MFVNLGCSAVLTLVVIEDDASDFYDFSGEYTSNLDEDAHNRQQFDLVHTIRNYGHEIMHNPWNRNSRSNRAI